MPFAIRSPFKTKWLASVEASNLDQAILQQNIASHSNGQARKSNACVAEPETSQAAFPSQHNLDNNDVVELLSLLSHNLKTRLIAAEGFSNLLLEELSDSLSDQHKHYLHRIRSNIQLMHRNINDLLDFARFGKMEAAPEQVDTDRFVKKLISDSFPRRAKHGIRFEIAQPLPVVHANRQSLRILFDNLLSNAVKYRHPARTAVIEIRCEQQPHFFAFHVRDNGIGLAYKEQASAFRLFQRGSNVGDIEGSGLGLAICQKVVRHLGGQIAMYSKPGKGTTVSFTLPK